jgi:hypothetical protein
LRLAAFEVTWIFLIFFLFSGSPPPDAGESHYLVKAKHYWNPAWCAGDLFLESADTHLAFYWVFGWLTQWFSLDVTTWILRIIIWGLLAWSWRRLSWALIPRPLWSLLSVGLMLLLAQHFHWSKEILLRGGVEGKTVAYVGVLLALESIVRNRWRTALLCAGGGAAFHVLVGGWTVVAIGLAWIASGRERPSLWQLWPAALGGLILALPGLIPSLALTSHLKADQIAEAYRIYAFDRLAHHLVVHRFPPVYWLRHGLLVAVWMWFVWLHWGDISLRRLMLVIGGTIAIAACGILLDQGLVLRANLLGQSSEAYERAAAPLLRYYWFRVEDALVPVGVALAISVSIYQMQWSRPALGQALLAAAIIAASLNVADACYWRARLRVPGAVLQQLATADTRLNWWWESPISEAPSAGADVGPSALSARERYKLWQSACSWIAENTPEAAKFLTPRRQQTFKWNAGRAEVATRKDLPQDPESILAWYAAVAELYPNDQAHRRFDLAAFSDDELTSLARKYNCQYIVVERRFGARDVSLPRVYPKARAQNPVFEIFRVPEGASP